MTDSKSESTVPTSPYEIVAAPTDVQGAEALKEISPHQFEWWTVDLVSARPRCCDTAGSRAQTWS